MTNWSKVRISEFDELKRCKVDHKGHVYVVDNVVFRPAARRLAVAARRQDDRAYRVRTIEFGERTLAGYLKFTREERVRATKDTRHGAYNIEDPVQRYQARLMIHVAKKVAAHNATMLNGF